MNNLRKYGHAPFNVAVVHGGPGAPGEMAPVGRELSVLGGVLEPLQTADSVSGQVRELHDLLCRHGQMPIILIGYSWGAWLSLIFTARHQALVKKLILVSSGPLEERYAHRIMDTRLSRLSQPERQEALELVASLNNTRIKNRDQLLSRFGKLMSKSDAFDPLPVSPDGEAPELQGEIFRKIWKEAAELRQKGELLTLSGQIHCPTVAVHGDYDPHPAEGIRKPLEQALKDFRFVLLKDCGHTPWVERRAKDSFYKVLREELG
ncbi:MAG: alpha/beta hydrolase [Candidatus Brocadiia bacterium]